MEPTTSTVSEVLQQPVSFEQADLHHSDQGMAEHGQHPNVNIDRGSATTHQHSQLDSSLTHSLNQESDYVTRLLNEQPPSQIHCAETVTLEHSVDPEVTASTKLLNNSERPETSTTSTTHSCQTADSARTTVPVSKDDHVTRSSVPTEEQLQAQDPGKGVAHKNNASPLSREDIDCQNGDSLSFSEEYSTNDHQYQIPTQMEDVIVTKNSSSSNFNEFMNVQMETELDSTQTDSISTVASEDNKIDQGVEKFDIESLSYELQVGYKILMGLMGAGNRCVNKLFIHPVDDSFPETAEYYSKIKKPMCMGKMKEKFESLQYADLTGFMADFRLMIENCYRFNGPDNFVSKKAQKLEMMMKQKIALLSKDLRDKLMGSVNTDDDILTSAGLRRRVRNPNMITEDPSQQLLSQLRRDKVLQEREDRKQRSEDKKALEQARIQEIQDWEDDFIGKETKDDLRTMWEIPQIGLFVYLCMETLGLDEEITQYQLERGLVAPRECSDFKRLMTCLLSTTHQRKSLKTLMPYHVWNSKLTVKVSHFYKILSDCNRNHQQACYKLGFDNRAFRIIGKSNPMLKRSFHELPFLKRVWILKSVCDFCLESQSELQKAIDEVESERPNDVREVLLGSDGRGNRYINFPMFTGKDIRIYRHPKLQEPSLRSLGLEDWSMVEEKPSNASSRCSTPVNQRSHRLSDQPSSSLRARAILQAAESKEASPMRDISRTGSDFQDENSNSNMDADSLSSDLTDGNVKKSGSSSKKRKRSGYYGGKRKRIKGGSRKQIILEDSVDSPNTEKEEDEGTGEQEMSPSPVSRKVQKESANSESAATIPESDPICDKNAISKDCDVSKNLLSTLPVETHPELEETSDSEYNTTLSNPTQLFNNYATNVENKPVSLPTEPSPEKEKAENLSSSSRNSDAKNQDSAYLSCDSEKSFKADDEMDVDKKAPPRTEPDSGKMEKTETDETTLRNKKSESSLEIESNGDVEKKESKELNDHAGASSPQGMKGEVNGVDANEGEESKGKAPLVDNTTDTLKTGVKEKGDQTDEKEAKSETPVKTDSSAAEEKDSMEIKEEPIEEEEEESDDEELPDLGHLELVAESMEEIRQLIHKLSNPDPIRRGKRVYPGVIKHCEEELLGNLQRFHDELTKYERSLFNARFHAQVKLRKEVENYVEVKIEDNKAWESETSQTSKETSDNEDSEPKKDVTPKEKPKRSRSKANATVTSTSELLSSAVNKLSTISGDANEDSNDSYELDISSRGRLRKRRIIPNNTEDTGLKKRKNLSQDLPSVSTSSSTSPSSNPGISSTSSGVTSVVSAGPQQQPLKFWRQQILSVVSSPSNSAIKAQLTSPSKPVLPCQIVRLVSPSGDASYKAVNLTGKQNVVLSPENMANIRFVSSTAVLTVPKNSIINSSSSAHSSHPVIQQLLLNQARRPMTGNVPIVKTVTSVKGNVPQAGILQSLTMPGSASKSLVPGMTPGHVKVTLVSPSPQDSTGLATTAKTPSTTAVVVTQVSTSIVSHGGKQILDLGSLSVTQIQQLVKNQAIQINTGAGNPTTLLLTKGLQQLATSKISPQSAITTLATSTPASSTFQIRMPMQRNPAPKSDAKEFPAKSLLSLSPGNSKLQVVTIPGTVSGQAGSMTVLSGRQVSPHLPVIRTIINRPIQNASIIRAVNPSVIGASIPVSHVMAGAARLPMVSQGTFTVVPGSVLPRQAPAPRIISSLPSTLSNLSSSGQGSANKENPPIPMNMASSADKPNAEIIDPKKSSFNNIPFSPHSSPQKKYASNVTVKALLENRTFKKSDNDGVAGVPQGKASSVPGSISKAVVTSITQEVVPSTSGSSSLTVNSSLPISAVPSTLPLDNTKSESSNAPVTSLKSIHDTKESVPTESDSQNHSIATSSEALPTISSSTSTQPLSVDTAIQPLLSSSVQVTLPTVNIKVPSPNTLPSLTHNKNSTIIVQSTKVPIPVASAEGIKTTDPSGSSGGGQFSKPLISSSSRMVASTVDSSPVANSNSSSTSQTTPSNAKAVTTSSTSGGSVNLKNVMLKLTPPKGTPSPFLQGFMTSKGKLVIPQSPGLQQHSQQVIQAPPNRVILANAAYNSQLQTSQLQARPAQVAGNLINQNIIKNIAFSQNSVLQPIQQQNGQVVIASQPTGTMSGVSPQAIPIQNGNPGIKVMLINQSNMSQVQQSGVIGGQTTTAAASMTLTRPQALLTSTPASELVKQIANSTQLLASAQQQSQVNKVNQSPTPQSQASTAGTSLINLNATAPTSTNLSAQSISGQVTLKSGQTQQASMNPQLAAQLLALQQSGKTLQVKQVAAQQQQAGIVLAAKPTAVQQQQPTQSPVMAVQLQQLGHQLLPGVSGLAQVQVPSSQLQQATVQSPLGAKPGQVVQLALNPQATNPNPAVLATGQPQAHIVQVAGQLSPHLQLANQSVSQLPQQGSIILQQPSIIQNQPQAVIRTPNASVLPMPVGSINQQKAAQSLKQAQVGGVATLTQQPQLPGSQAQIQLVINSSAASSSAQLSLGTVLRKQTPVSTVNVPQLTSTQQIIRAIVNPGAGTSSAMSAPRLLSPTKPTLSINSSPQALLGTNTQLSQVLTQNVVNANQLLISPLKLTPQLPQMNRATPVKFINPTPSALHPGLTGGASASQLVQKFQLNNGSQGTNPSQGGLLVQKPILSVGTPNANTAQVGTEKITQRLLSQPTAKIVSLKQPLATGDALSQNLNSLATTQSVASFLSSSVAPMNSSLTAQPADGLHQPNLLALSSAQSRQVPRTNLMERVSHGSIATVSSSLEGKTQLISSQPTTANSAQAPGGVVVQNSTNSLSVSKRNKKVQENGVSADAAQNAIRTPSETNFTSPSKSCSSRRNTFSGSQENPKAVQRNTSVDESSSSLLSKEMDEKEAALNLLTLANQPL